MQSVFKNKCYLSLYIKYISGCQGQWWEERTDCKGIQGNFFFGLPKCSVSWCGSTCITVCIFQNSWNFIPKIWENYVHLTLENQSLIKADALHSGKSLPEKLHVKWYMLNFSISSALIINMLCIQSSVGTQEDMAKYLSFLKVSKHTVSK